MNTALRHETIRALGNNRGFCLGHAMAASQFAALHTRTAMQRKWWPGRPKFPIVLLWPVRTSRPCGKQRANGAGREMVAENEPTIIKKYANRRLYNTGTSTYVTLDDLGEMVKAEEDFVVIDAKTGDDITRSVLTQIIFEQESRGPQLLPINFLRQLIRFYGDSMQTLVPSYLDFSMSSLAKEQGKLRAEMAKTLGATTIGAMEEHAKRNMAMFEQAFRMFSPFPGQGMKSEESSERAASDASGSSELDLMKKQLSEMQNQLNKLSGKP